MESIEPNKNYPVLLLHLIDKGDVDIHIRVSAAIAFKNFVKRNWRVVSAAKIDVERLLAFSILTDSQVEDVGDRIHADDRNVVKQIVVGLMLKSPEKIQNQVLLYYISVYQYFSLSTVTI